MASEKAITTPSQASRDPTSTSNPPMAEDLQKAWDAAMLALLTALDNPKVTGIDFPSRVESSYQSLETTWNTAQKALQSDERWESRKSTPGKIESSHRREWYAKQQPSWYSPQKLKATVHKYLGDSLKKHAESMVDELDTKDVRFREVIEKIRAREKSTEATATAGTGTSSGTGL